MAKTEISEKPQLLKPTRVQTIHILKTATGSEPPLITDGF